MTQMGTDLKCVKNDTKRDGLVWQRKENLDAKIKCFI